VVDGNLGSQADDEVPGGSLVLGRALCGEILSVAYAVTVSIRMGRQDRPRHSEHLSLITSKSTLPGDGPLDVPRAVEGSRGLSQRQSQVEFDALLLDEQARTDTYPYIGSREKKVNTSTRPRLPGRRDQLFYLMSRLEGGGHGDGSQQLHRADRQELPLEYAIS